MFHDLSFILDFVGKAFLHTWPYLVLSIPLAVAVRVSNASQYIRRAFIRQPAIAILLATLVGAFSPFCSCGVIPVITSLLIARVPLGPVMAFWIASPAMDPEIFLLSVSMLGWKLAVARLVATLLLSLTAGFTAEYLEQHDFFQAGILRESRQRIQWSWRKSLSTIAANGLAWLRHPARQPVRQSAWDTACCTATPTAVLAQTLAVNGAATKCAGSCAAYSTGITAETQRTQKKDTDSRPTFRHELWSASVDATVMVVKFMLLAFVLEALITLYVPQNNIVALLGAENPLAISAAALVGVPIYTSNLTALPLIGGLLQQGMLPGAALAFLISGPTTTIPAMAAVYGIAKPRVFALYVLSVLVGAIVAGYAYQFVLAL